MGRTQKSKLFRASTVTSVTPQPSTATKRPNYEKLRKSESPVKRKKLAQELDEEISDSEFDAQLDKMRAEEKQLKRKKVDNVKSSKAEDDSEDEDDEDDSEDADSDDEDVERDDNDDEDSDDENDETKDEDADSDDEDDDADTDDEDDDSEAVSSEDESSDGDNSHMEHEDATNTKSGTKSPVQKRKSDSKTKQQMKKAEETIPIEATEMAQDLIAKASMDKRTLFLKNLPQSVTADIIRSFSSDVLRVRILPFKAKKSRNLRCAFVEFSDEKTAIRNRTNFEDKKIDEKEISVDFVGEKSTFRPKKPQLPTSVDPKKLYISGVGKEVTVEDLKKLCPAASSIDLPHYKKENYHKGFAFIHFTDEKACKDAHAAIQNQVLGGRAISVMYGKKRQPESEDLKKNIQSSKRPRKNKEAASESVDKKDSGEERDSGENTEDSSENDSD